MQLRAELIQILSIKLGLDMLPKIGQMRDNRRFGCSTIHVNDSINYLLMLRDGPSPNRWRKIEVTYRLGLAMQRIYERREDSVPRHPGNRRMELGIKFRDARVIDCPSLFFPHNIAKFGDIRVGPVSCSQNSGRHFEILPDHRDFLETDSAELKQVVHRFAENFAERMVVNRLHKASTTAARNLANQALVSQHRQSLPDRWSADAELAGKLGLGRESLTHAQLATQYRVTQNLFDLLPRSKHPLTQYWRLADTVSITTIGRHVNLYSLSLSSAFK
jgi:hypothetical protein